MHVKRGGEEAENPEQNQVVEMLVVRWLKVVRLLKALIIGN